MQTPLLLPVDKLEFRILVDNTTDSLSTAPPHAETEFASLARRGLRIMGGDDLCCACHGFSTLITAHVGSARRTVLFDAGPEEQAFERNAERLHANLGEVEAVVLSHGHWDHAGGLLRAIDLVRTANGGHAIPVHAHAGMFRARAMRLPNGERMAFREIPSADRMTQRGASVVDAPGAHSLLDRAFLVTGEIPRATPFEQGFPGHERRTEDGTGWEPDPLLLDERALIAHVRGKGLVVFSSCSHAGIVNVLRHARDLAPGVPIYAAVGGLHLAGATERAIPATIDALRAFDLRVIAAGHCTGWRATAALSHAFGNALDPTAVGKRYVF